MAHGGEGIAAALLLFQDVIVRLMLKPLRGERRFEMRPQERHAVALVGVWTQPHAAAELPLQTATVRAN